MKVNKPCKNDRKNKRKIHQHTPVSDAGHPPLVLGRWHDRHRSDAKGVASHWSRRTLGNRSHLHIHTHMHAHTMHAHTHMHAHTRARTHAYTQTKPAFYPCHFWCIYIERERDLCEWKLDCFCEGRRIPQTEEEKKEKKGTHTKKLLKH